MTPYEVYVDYLALKRHFTTDDYDYHRYNGRVRTSVAAFERRRDKWHFVRLARHRDPHGFLLANSVRRGRPPWVGDLSADESAEAEFVGWRKRVESLTYVLRTELAGLDADCMTPIDGRMPPIVVDYIGGRVSLETLTILAALTNATPTWRRRVKDVVVWPDVVRRVEKYRPFLEFDRDRAKAVVLGWLERVSD